MPSYQEHEVFEAPVNLDIKVWRYIDFTKLISLLESQSLYMARADTLGDPFEGSYSRANIDLRPQLYGELDAGADLVQRLPQITEAFRWNTYVNCWNMSDHESAALWGLYVPPSGGVAIQSTFQLLVDAFPPDDDVNDPIYVGTVQYVDYTKAFIPENNLLAAFVHKRLSFAFENEVRVVMLRLPKAEDGRQVSPSSSNAYALGYPVAVDLSTMIQAIYVSPVAPKWFAALVQTVCARYGLAVPVRQSALAAAPVF